MHNFIDRRKKTNKRKHIQIRPVLVTNLSSDLPVHLPENAVFINNKMSVQNRSLKSINYTRTPVGKRINEKT